MSLYTMLEDLMGWNDTQLIRVLEPMDGGWHLMLIGTPSGLGNYANDYGFLTRSVREITVEDDMFVVKLGEKTEYDP